MARFDREKLVVVKCAYCGSEFLVRLDRILPKMYCTLRCLEADRGNVVEEVKAVH